MYNDNIPTSSCGPIIEEESPRIPEIHLAFGRLRDKMDNVNKRLDSIANVFRGECCGADKPSTIKEVEVLPHQMGLSSNFEALEMRIDKASEMIENLYSMLGMEQGKLY